MVGSRYSHIHLFMIENGNEFKIDNQISNFTSNAQNDPHSESTLVDIDCSHSVQHVCNDPRELEKRRYVLSS